MHSYMKKIATKPACIITFGTTATSFLPRLPPVPLVPLEPKVQGDSDHQSAAETRRSPVVVESSCLPGADRAASVQVGGYRIAETGDGNQREGAGDDKGDLAGFIAKVEQGRGDSADVNGEFKLQTRSARVSPNGSQHVKDHDMHRQEGTYPAQECPLRREIHLGLYPHRNVNLLPLGRLELLVLNLGRAI